MEFYKIRERVVRNGEKDEGKPDYSRASLSCSPDPDGGTPGTPNHPDVTLQKKQRIRKRSRDVNITVCGGLEQDAGDKEGELKLKWAAAEGGSSTSEVKAVDGSKSLEKHLRGSGGGDAADWICIFTQLLLVLRLK